MSVLIGIRWSSRLGNPRGENWRAYLYYYPLDFVRYHYEWAFPAINYLFQAMVCAFLWICYRSHGNELGDSADP